MNATEKLKAVIGLSDARMQDWINLFREMFSRITPIDDQRRLLEIRHDADSYFIAEMDSRHRDEAPVTDDELYRLIDEFLIEIGILGVPPRRKPGKKPPWQKKRT